MEVAKRVNCVQNRARDYIILAMVITINRMEQENKKCA